MLNFKLSSPLWYSLDPVTSKVMIEVICYSWILTSQQIKYQMSEIEEKNLLHSKDFIVSNFTMIKFLAQTFRNDSNMTSDRLKIDTWLDGKLFLFS